MLRLTFLKNLEDASLRFLIGYDVKHSKVFGLKGTAMTTQDALLQQIRALPLAARLQIRAALDESVEQDLSTAADSPVTRERLEAELQAGLDSGPSFPVDESYWQELSHRIERRRLSAS
ncbi:MAG TPA: hypothetical protein VFG20_01825 [Planctomycetaceae bacterium]|nr:hypothetical protein [Planctomycetaceae bacterium]